MTIAQLFLFLVRLLAGLTIGTGGNEMLNVILGTNIGDHLAYIAHTIG